jgi:hypothetical protein
MQMIDVLKRLAELDAGNSNVVNPMTKQTVAEDASLEECGMMGGMEAPKTQLQSILQQETAKS